MPRQPPPRSLDGLTVSRVSRSPDLGNDRRVVRPWWWRPGVSAGVPADQINDGGVVSGWRP
jgi:hypothetical protein